MLEKWIFTDTASLLAVALSSVTVYLAIIVYCRITGLRSFSKMSTSDFAMTVAVGSLFASTISSPQPSLLLGLFALALLFLGQWLLARVRQRFSKIQTLTDNQPLLLMRGEEILEDNLRAAGVAKTDLVAKLREANVLDFGQVRAVVFETTGDISVLHSGEASRELSPDLLEGVASEVTPR